MGTSFWISLAVAALAVAIIALAPGNSAEPKGAELVPLEESLEGAGFTRIDESEGVRVYRDKDADEIRVAGEGRIAGSPDAILDAVTDYRAQDGRVERVVEARVLEREDGSLRVYQHLDLPFIDDRDFVLDVRWSRVASPKWVKFHAVADERIPVKDDVVRVELHRGSWQIDGAREEAGALVRFQSRIDLGGMLPMWMAKMGAGDEIPRLFENIRALVESGREQSQDR